MHDDEGWRFAAFEKNGRIDSVRFNALSKLFAESERGAEKSEAKTSATLSGWSRRGF